MQVTRNEQPIQEVSVRVDDVNLAGYLRVPEPRTGVVLFAHGSGSGRESPRNQYVAGKLSEAGLATLLIDLLTEKEEAVDVASGALRFDTEFLAHRLSGALDWLRENPFTQELPIGLFGASTGAAAALRAAAAAPAIVRAVVSRGGRPDLAESALNHVQAPTLLIVGQRDEPVLQVNAQAAGRLPETTKQDLQIIPGATHLFEEPGALEAVADLAQAWFLKHLNL